MNRPGQRSQRNATLSILGVLAIPFASVTAAALMAGPISDADPARMSTSLLAVVMGSVVGLSLLRVLRSAHLGIRSAVVAAVDWVESESDVHVLATTTPLIVVPVARPIIAVHASSLGRRGPPSGL